MQLHAFKWSTSIDRAEILNWFHNFYVVPSSTYAIMSTVQWLEIYKSGQWTTFDEFPAWKSSCWLVSPLSSCTCPKGLKEYLCKHSVGLAIVLNIYQVSDVTKFTPVGKRKTPGRPKKVRTALLHWLTHHMLCSLSVNVTSVFLILILIWLINNR